MPWNPKDKQLNLRSKFNKVKTAKGRKTSSKNWLQRQLNDPYVALAQKQGYRSRAAFKLIEINKKFNLFHKGQRILDLGAAPGGWSQVAAQLTKNNNSIVALDLLEMDPIDGVQFFQGDFTDPMMIEKLLLNNKFDIVMSDMAANTTGHAATDHLRIMSLVEEVYYLSTKILKPGGNMIIKIFRGGAENNLLLKIKESFKSVKHFKPSSSRSNSTEMYMIATNFNP